MTNCAIPWPNRHYTRDDRPLSALNRRWSRIGHNLPMVPFRSQIADRAVSVVSEYTTDRPQSALSARNADGPVSVAIGQWSRFGTFSGIGRSSRFGPYQSVAVSALSGLRPLRHDRNIPPKGPLQYDRNIPPKGPPRSGRLFGMRRGPRERSQTADATSRIAEYRSYTVYHKTEPENLKSQNVILKLKLKMRELGSVVFLSHSSSKEGA